MGERVEYRDDQRVKQIGRIQEVQGKGKAARYSVLNEQTQKLDQCSEQDIERELER
ncbi:hypothetical protein NGB36_07820 [Streptomyces sp. RB6PN25]|uniref:Uncharacterized protein n=1 Tax=Streptomyces humicola TaxID=2953240 RepID=A0ABT1PVE1_9ACTN|nr:hypothetical protein [Streptomyces humicola]MCQ4080510.1 hypothetical protein [Streptomyces humicola]